MSPVVGSAHADLAAADLAAADLAAAEPAAQSLSTKARQRVLPWVLAGVAIFLVCLFVFKKTVFFGDNLSIASHLLLQDTFFNPALPGRELDCITDSTPYTLLIPYQNMIRHCLELHGKFPLWNDLNACGLPLIGDPMTFMFSPFTLLFAFANSHVFSVVLASYFLIGALGTLLLAKRLGLTPLPATFTALAFAFNPFLARFAELPDQPCLVPWIALATLSLACRGFWRSIALGIICGAIPYVMHAECAFAAVAGAWFLVLALMLGDGAESARQKLKTFAASLSLAGISGCIFAAPLLLPMYEFFINTICYKSAVNVCRGIPANSLLFDLIHPCCKGDSFFAGILLLGLLALGFLSRTNLSKALSIAIVCSFWVVAKIFPLDLLFQLRPFSFFMPLYAAPVLLLFLCLLAGLGMAKIGESSFKNKLLCCSVLVLSALIPLIMALMNADISKWQFDAIIPQVSVTEAYLQAFIALAASLLLFVRLRAGWPANGLVPVALIALNLLSVSGAFKSSLPIIPGFNYPKTDVVAYFQEHKERLLAVSNHMLLANTNAVYGINDFRVINPLLPRRYTDFMLKSGAQRQGLSVFVWGDWNLGPEIDLASVKYIIVKEGEDKDLSAERFKLLKTFQGQLRVYENKCALPEAYVAYSAIHSKSLEQSLALIRSKEFDPRKQVISENQPTAPDGQKRSEAGPGALDTITAASQLTRPDSQTVKIKFTAHHPGILVLTDSFYPGWTARLDSKLTEIFPVNAMFRGIRVSPGEHEVVYEFASASFENGLKIFMSGFCILLLLALGRFRQQRK